MKTALLPSWSALSRVLALVVALALPAAWAQPAQRLEPLPDVPPPPRMSIDPSAEPTVTIIQRGREKVEEFRIRGRLYMVRVTPPGGVPYVLVDQKGDGQFAAPTSGPADAHNLSVPMWVIGTF
ncbi:MAG: DUF2782 domain-containing protein [Burkholderiales bacterium]